MIYYAAFFFFLDNQKSDFCSHPAAVAVSECTLKVIFFFFFCLSSDRYVTLPSLFLDLLSVLRVEKGRKLKGKKQIGLYFKFGLNLDRRNPWKLVRKGSRFPGPSLLTAGIVEGFTGGGLGNFSAREHNQGPSATLQGMLA